MVQITKNLSLNTHSWDFKHPNFGRLSLRRLSDVVAEASRRPDYQLALVAVAWRDSRSTYRQCSWVPVLAPRAPYVVSDDELTREFAEANPRLYIGGATFIRTQWDFAFLDDVVSPLWFQAILEGE